MNIQHDNCFRGRNPDDKQAANEKLLRELYDLLSGLLTGDVRQPRISHLCVGCCSGPRDTAMKLSDAIIASFVELMTSKDPSTIKFYTLEQALCSATGLFMIHNIGGDTVPRAIGVPEEEERDNDGQIDDEAQNFRFFCNRKNTLARDAALSEDFHFDLTVATWASEPLQKLNNLLQHVESDGGCLFEATFSQGPVRATEVELHRRAVSSPDTLFPLEFIVHHFEVRPELNLIIAERQAFGLLDLCVSF